MKTDNSNPSFSSFPSPLPSPPSAQASFAQAMKAAADAARSRKELQQELEYDRSLLKRLLNRREESIAQGKVVHEDSELSLEINDLEDDIAEMVDELEQYG